MSAAVISDPARVAALDAPAVAAELDGLVAIAVKAEARARKAKRVADAYAARVSNALYPQIAAAIDDWNDKGRDDWRFYDFTVNVSVVTAETAVVGVVVEIGSITRRDMSAALDRQEAWHIGEDALLRGLRECLPVAIRLPNDCRLRIVLSRQLEPFTRKT